VRFLHYAWSTLVSERHLRRHLMPELVLSEETHAANAQSHGLILDCQCTDPD
jgi:hypothetical protein